MTGRSRRLRSAINYFAGVEATCRITGIDELRIFDDAPVVVAGMIGGNEHAVILVEVFQRRALHVQVILAPATYKRKVGIAVADLDAALRSSSMILSEGDSRRSSMSFL